MTPGRVMPAGSFLFYRKFRFPIEQNPPGGMISPNLFRKYAPVSNLFTEEMEERTMNASVAIQSLPSAENDEELIRIVDEVIDYIKGTGLNYYVGPFETTIEGDYDELMDIVKECQHIAVRAGAPSVAAYIKVSYRPEGDVLTIEKKVSKHHK